MAKPENPAEGFCSVRGPEASRGAPSAARPPRPVQRVRLDAPSEPHAPRAREVGALSRDSVAVDAVSISAAIAIEAVSIDGAEDDFDTRRNLVAPHSLAEREVFADRELLVARELEAHDFGDEELAADEELLREHDPLGRGAAALGGEPGLAAREASPVSRGDRPGLAWVRPGTGSVARGAVEVPVANLEPPSTSRFDLTPSPVPRVALAPATGSVDVSLVPGPRAVGSRNMPTLAAQHVLGRRPRRPAAAVTLPPPAPATRESGVAAGLARDVRSSKGEIVIGLMIGLGVSLLLAGLGQAYLRGGDAIVAEQGEPSQLQSVTLSARPESPAAVPESAAGSAAASTASDAVDEKAGGASAAAPNAAARASTEASSGRDSHGNVAPSRVSSSRVSSGHVSSGHVSSSRASHVAGLTAGEASAVTVALRAGEDGQARAAGAKRASRALPRATPARATRAQPPAAIAVQPPPFEAAVEAHPAASERDPSRAPLTPAQSAGLGLDLPF